MGCSKCKYSPETYEEYCSGQRDPSTYCPDAYTEKSHLCGNYEKEDNCTDYGSLEKKHLGNPEDKTGIYADYDEPNTIYMNN